MKFRTAFSRQLLLIDWREVQMATQLDAPQEQPILLCDCWYCVEIPNLGPVPTHCNCVDCLQKPLGSFVWTPCRCHFCISKMYGYVPRDGVAWYVRSTILTREGRPRPQDTPRRCRCIFCAPFTPPIYGVVFSQPGRFYNCAL